MSLKIITGASQILTMEGSGWKPLSGESMESLSIKNGVSVVIDGSKIREIIPNSRLDSFISSENPEVIDAAGKVVMPGFVDSHTHIVYGGSRHEEFYQKLQGRTYLEILNSGNGIYRTVQDTRNTDEDTIYRQSLERVRDAISTGTTYMEMKTGYGLDAESEMKMLRVMDRISATGTMGVSKTFLPLHAIPKGMTESSYVEMVIEKMLPLFKGKARFADSFCDRGAFSKESTERFFRATSSMGFELRLHADELANIGCLDLINGNKVRSVDHLLETDNSGMERIKASGAVANFLPITAFNIKDGKYPDIGIFYENQVPFSISTDCSPVSGNTSMLFSIYLAVRYCGISIEAALSAATINGAFSLGENNRVGSIEPGKSADLIILNASDYREIPYRYGSRMISRVMKNGEIIYHDSSSFF